YTEAIQKCLKERGIEQGDPRLRDWQKALAHVKDPRRKEGQRFTLTSILLLALAAILSNHLSELAIAQWGAGQSDEVKKALGFEKGVTPHQSTINRLFRSLSAEKLETAFRGIFLQIFEQEEKKQKSELAVAYRLILQIDWKGKVLTGDALYCQRCLCAAILLAGGDYLFIVKANQPQLFEDLRLLFAPPAPAKRAGEGILRLAEQHAQTTDKGHGRVEIRSIRVSSELKGYSDWPGLDQVFQIRRRWQSKGEWREEVRYGITSLPAPVGIPERLLTFKRGHWTIENCLHYVKDVTLGEDRRTVHADNGPKIMAALRNTAVSLLRRAGFSTIAARMRYNCGHPQAALQVLSLSLS